MRSFHAGLGEFFVEHYRHLPVRKSVRSFCIFRGEPMEKTLLQGHEACMIHDRLSNKPANAEERIKVLVALGGDVCKVVVKQRRDPIAFFVNLDVV